MVIKEYLNEIKAYLWNTIINLQIPDMCKIKLKIAINFISSKIVDEECVMHSKIDNIESMVYDNRNKVVGDFFESLFSRYQIGWETLMRRSDFIFDSVKMVYYKNHKINVTRGGSYTDSPDWVEKRKATIINVFNMHQQLH